MEYNSKLINSKKIKDYRLKIKVWLFCPSPLAPCPLPLNNIELAHISINQWDDFLSFLPKCDQQTVLVVEDICRNRPLWQQIARDPRTGTTFDLYYCGIVFFDTKRYKHNYKINF
jgi:hypothetical protein